MDGTGGLKSSADECGACACIGPAGGGLDEAGSVIRVAESKDSEGCMGACADEGCMGE